MTDSVLKPESLMANICNKLEKLPPPAFVTTRTLNKRQVVQQWRIIKHQSTYPKLCEILSDEFKLFSGYIDRKGAQLRLEKALMLTKQIQKLSVRWKSNELVSHFETFEKALAILKHPGTGKRGANMMDALETDDQRLPSSQWATYLIYLTMREALLLTKISIECEKTVKFWLGLIAAGHHWGDSLVASAILARLWFTSAKAVEELANTVFPVLHQMQMRLQPSGAGPWPSDEFKVPSSLLQWVRKDMNLPFAGAADRDLLAFTKQKKQKTPFIEKFLGSVEVGHGDIEDELERQFAAESMETESNTGTRVPSASALEEDLGAAVSDVSDLGFFIDVQGDFEDLGTPVGKKQKLAKEKKDARSKRVKTGSKTSKTNVLSEMPWKKFFTNVETKLKTVKGHKILKSRCKKILLADDQDAKVKLKVKKLRKALISFKDEQKGDVTIEDIRNQYEKLKTLLTKSSS